MRPLQRLLQCLLASVVLECSTTLAAEHRPQYPLAPFQRLDEAYSNHEPLLSLHKRLVEIESITGNEHDVGVYLHDYLALHNFTVEKQSVCTASDDQSKKQPRFNIFAYSGEKRDTRVLVSSRVSFRRVFAPMDCNSRLLRHVSAASAKKHIACFRPISTRRNAESATI